MAITLQGESRTIDSADLKWLDDTTPGLTHDIKQANCGGAFSTVGTAAAGATTFQVTGLSTKTCYQFQVCQGATCSNIITVVTHGCAVPKGMDGVNLQRVQDSVKPNDFNIAMEQLESILGTGIPTATHGECEVCPENGAIEINCSDVCRTWNIVMTEDVNSISINYCGDVVDGTIQFRIPANTTRRICGFPTGFGFSGNECFDAPLEGGPEGRTMSIPFKGNKGATRTSSGPRARTPAGTAGKGIGSSGPGGGASGAPLTVTCKTSTGGNNVSCSVDCSGTKEIRFTVAGGTPPYSASTNSGGTITQLSSNSFKLVPPTNSNPSEPGVAWSETGLQCTNCSGNSCTTISATDTARYGCDDAFQMCAAGADGTTPPGSITPANIKCSGVGPCGTGIPSCGPSCPGYGEPFSTYVIDRRTGAMIAAGCNPCGSSMNNKTFTIMDAAMTSVVTVVRASNNEA